MWLVKRKQEVYHARGRKRGRHDFSRQYSKGLGIRWRPGRFYLGHEVGHALLSQPKCRFCGDASQMFDFILHPKKELALWS